MIPCTMLKLDLSSYNKAFAQKRLKIPCKYVDVYVLS